MLARDSVRDTLASSYGKQNLLSICNFPQLDLHDDLLGIHTSGCGKQNLFAVCGYNFAVLTLDVHTSSVYIMSYQCNDVIEHAG